MSLLQDWIKKCTQYIYVYIRWMSKLCVGNSSVVKIYIIRPKPGHWTKKWRQTWNWHPKRPFSPPFLASLFDGSWPTRYIYSSVYIIHFARAKHDRTRTIGLDINWISYENNRSRMAHRSHSEIATQFQIHFSHLIWIWCFSNSILFSNSIFLLYF